MHDGSDTWTGIESTRVENLTTAYVPSGDGLTGIVQGPLQPGAATSLPLSRNYGVAGTSRYRRQGSIMLTLVVSSQHLVPPGIKMIGCIAP